VRGRRIRASISFFLALFFLTPLFLPFVLSPFLFTLFPDPATTATSRTLSSRYPPDSFFPTYPPRRLISSRGERSGTAELFVLKRRRKEGNGGFLLTANSLLSFLGTPASRPPARQIYYFLLLSVCNFFLQLFEVARKSFQTRKREAEKKCSFSVFFSCFFSFPGSFFSTSVSSVPIGPAHDAPRRASPPSGEIGRGEIGFRGQRGGGEGRVQRQGEECLRKKMQRN